MKFVFSDLKFNIKIERARSLLEDHVSQEF